VKADVSNIKKMLKSMAKKIKAYGQGIEAWYRMFDKDNSDEIEVNELFHMLEKLDI
jgi:Ca2+-binding EF-hand superfamily protein